MARATSSPSLQEPPGPPLQPTRRSSPTTTPTRALGTRARRRHRHLLASANDLVVPSEGGWRVDRDGTPYMPGDRIGCFGPGGNLSTTDGGPVDARRLLLEAGDRRVSRAGAGRGAADADRDRS